MDPIYNEFEVASGSIIGNYHTRINFNNQDYYQITEKSDHMVAVVCDGCSGGETSEVGSVLGASIVSWELSAAGIHRIDYDPNDIKVRLEHARRFILDRIIEISFKTGLPFVEAISSSFLFTIVAAIIGREYTYIVSIGDGFYSINGHTKEIGPFEDNAPPYIAYGAIQEHLKRPVDSGFVINEVIPTNMVESLFIATDGIGDFIKSENKKLPGKKELVGPLNQFWIDDLYFSNQAAVGRKLLMTNRTVTKMDRERCRLIHEHGYLSDDTTLISIRRKPSFQIL